MIKLIRFLIKFFICGLFLGIGGFLGLSLYYRSYFPVNTWINGIYCTGKTVSQVNEELIEAEEVSPIYVVDAENVNWEMDMEEAGIQLDYTSSLQSYIDGNEYFDWLDNLQEPVSNELTAKYIIDEVKLSESFEALAFVQEEQNREAGVSVCLADGSYVLEDNNCRRLNIEKAYAYLRDCLSKGQMTVDLMAGGCYEDIEDTFADKIQRDLWSHICEFTDNSSRIVYDMGAEQIAFTADIALQFLDTEQGSGLPFLNQNGNLMVNEAKVQEWVEQLALDYDTCDTEKEFLATRGDVVTVKYVTYGTKLDVDAETAYLLEALNTKFREVQYHVPAYSQQGYVRGLDDIGDTYIEIDMTEQKLFYYVDGALELETDVVTGNMAGMRTPEGINFVYAKQRNRILRGPGYASFVKYWMPVKGAIGIHDASWRSKFGGEIYKTNGSHGCINLPSDIAGQLYDMVEIGTPVIMFY